MRTLWLHPRPPESQTLGVGPSKQCFNKPARIFWGTNERENGSSPKPSHISAFQPGFPCLNGWHFWTIMQEFASCSYQRTLILAQGSSLSKPSGIQSLSLLPASCQLHTELCCFRLHPQFWSDRWTTQTPNRDPISPHALGHAVASASEMFPKPVSLALQLLFLASSTRTCTSTHRSSVPRKSGLGLITWTPGLIAISVWWMTPFLCGTLVLERGD